MRTYLVVIDETEEARVALRFAARRAAKTGGSVEIVALIPPAEFAAWAGVQATIEDEARQKVEALVAAAAGTLAEEAGIRPTITVRQGEPVTVILDILESSDQIAALVLGAAANGAPGPLVSHFAGNDAGRLPCPIMVVPGSLDEDAIDRLS